MERSIKSPQTHVRLLHLTLTTTGTPAVSGPDKNQVDSVVDNGVGDVTIIFKRPFTLAPIVEVNPSGTTQQLAWLKAKDVDRVTINIVAKPAVSSALAALATASAVASDAAATLQTAAAAASTIAAADATIQANVEAAFTAISAAATAQAAAETAQGNLGDGLALSTSVGCAAADGVVDLVIVGKDDRFYR